MNILALIPARSGSKGVPKKNIKLLDSHPLISYTIAAANLSKKINRVIVTTDAKEVALISEKYGAEVPFLRPENLASDTSTDLDFIKHALIYLENKENYIPDLIILLRPTTPLRNVKYIDDAIDKLIKNNEATSLRSSHLAAETPFKWFAMIDKFYAPICEKYVLEDTDRPRQYFPEIYVPNGYIDIIKPSHVKKYNSVYGEKILGFITPNGHEIDTKDDFNYVEYLLIKNGSALLGYLNMKKIYKL